MPEAAKPRPYSVSSLTAALKTLIEGSFTRIYVEAEISGWKRYPSGHCYFALKDDGAQVSAVMFASAFERCKAKDGLKDGAKVLVYANATVYPPRGNYQLVVLAAKLAGEGELMQRYLELKAKLEAEGLFAPSRKRPLPFMPRRIAIVTSEAGAVIHDMCTVLSRRFPAVEIRLYPSLVQGEGAPASIVAGIEYFGSSSWRADLLIVARGGGSFEDLFCFNDETLVRAVASSRIPTISAVGHETDFTLCDFAADRRAGTPSIAAEIAVPVLSELTQSLDASLSRLTSSLRNRGDFFAQRVDHLGAALGAALAQAHGNARSRLDRLVPRLEPVLKLRLQAVRTQLDRAAARLEPALALRLQAVRARFEKAEARLEAYSPYGVLERGYSITTAADGTVIRNAASVREGDVLTTRLGTGTVRSSVLQNLI